MEQASSVNFTFSLRLSCSAGTDRWQITLYDAQTGTYLRFASLAQLDAFLHIVTRSAAASDLPAEQPDPQR